MEVHHHAHTSDPDIQRGRKKWTHYFWEFLMLFLAVFAGFLAENQREHLVENRRAKEYAKSLVTDLQIDIGELERGIQQTKFIIEAIDSIIGISLKWSNQPTIPGSFYFYSRFVSYTYRIDWSRSTIDQLIQSGNLRYFRDKNLVNGINYYYYQGGFMNTEYQRDVLIMDKVSESRNRILLRQYYSVFAKMNLVRESKAHVPSKPIDSLKMLQLPLREGAGKLMDEFINYLSDRKERLIKASGSYYPDAIEVAEDLIKILKKEYHL